jgi:membrane-bound lytic murein transglycosylase D
MRNLTFAILSVGCSLLFTPFANAQQVYNNDIGAAELPDHDYLKSNLPNLFESKNQKKEPKYNHQELSDDQKKVLRRIYDVYKIHLKAVQNELNNKPEAAEKYILASLKDISKLIQEYPDIKNNKRFKELYRTIYTEYSSFYGIDRTKNRERGKIFTLQREFMNDKDNWMKGEYVLPKNIVKPKTVVPLVFNDHVNQHIAFFTQDHQEVMNHWLKRSKKYFPMMKKIFKKVGVPPELVHLSMIESGLNPFARSWASAVGMWQFIPSTARQYGLKINFWVDERRDPIKETYAAARYLQDLHKEWGNWYLAMANYNCSTSAVMRAIQKDGGTKNYWKALPYLPRQTQEYVPGFIATTLIARNAKDFGFKTKFQVKPYSYNIVKVAPLMPLKKLAKVAGIPLKELKEYNPALRRWATPPGSKYPLKLPKGIKQSFLASYRKIPKNKRSKGAVVHTVHRGETLGYIAGKYGATVHAILAANKGLTSLIYPGQKIVVPLAPGSSTDIATRAMSANKKSRSSRKTHLSRRSHSRSTKVVYRVKPGDTIGAIAERYGVRASQIRSWNHTSNLIHPGDRLRIYVPKGYAPKSSSPGGGTIHYTVRRHDTLGKIAHKFGVSVHAIEAANHLHNSRIYAGQRLRIRAKTIDYIVRANDTLSGIANAFGTSVQDIKQMNGLSNSIIYQGQHLRINMEN